MAANRPIHNHIFYEGVLNTDEIDSCIMPVVSDESTLILKFKCSGTFIAKIYQGILNKDEMYPHSALKRPTYDLITDISDDNFLYEVDVTGIDYLKVKITELKDGELSVYGKVVG